MDPVSNHQSKNGYIYSIESPEGYFYIGSTINSLKCRLYEHIQHSKKYPDRKVYNYFNSINWKDIKISEIESFTFTNRKEMIEKENTYIKDNLLNPLCLNTNESILTRHELQLKQKEYRLENKEKIHEYRKVYNEQNAEDRNAYSKKWKEENREQAAETRKQYYETHKEEILEKCKRYVEENKEVVAERKRKWVEENKDKLKENNKEYRNEKKEVIQEKGKQYYEENKELIRQKQKEYREKHKEKFAKQEAEKRAKVFSEPPIQCDCGGHYHSIDHSKHFKTNRHRKYEDNKKSIEVVCAVQKGDE